MVFRYHLFRLFFWGVSSIIGIGLARTVLFPLIIALSSGAATFVIATTGATSRVVFGRFPIPREPGFYRCSYPGNFQ